MQQEAEGCNPHLTAHSLTSFESTRHQLSTTELTNWFDWTSAGAPLLAPASGAGRDLPCDFSLNACGARTVAGGGNHSARSSLLPPPMHTRAPPLDVADGLGVRFLTFDSCAIYRRKNDRARLFGQRFV